MADIDVQSPTWRAVMAFAQAQKDQAIDNLIADNHSEQQRGKLALLDELHKLTAEKPAPIPGAGYLD